MTSRRRSKPQAEPSWPAVGFRWLIRLRWLAATAQALGLLAARFLGSGSVPRELWIPFGVVLTNLAAERLAARYGPHRTATGLLALDTVLLTVLLAATGGVANPFTIFFLVHITLSALVLSSSATWFIAALSVGAFGSLFLASSGSGSHAAHEAVGTLMSQHLRGMWIAFVTAAIATAAFVTALRSALERGEQEVRRLRSERDRNERLAALSTLVGGAAHELATPLATIGVVVSELKRAATAPETAEDLDLISGELSRCRSILDEMAAGAGESPGENLEITRTESLVEDALERLGRERRGRVSVENAVPDLTLELPRRAVARALETLLRNGFDASPIDSPVTLTVTRDQLVRFDVRDHGRGLDDEELRRAGEPFFTTKGVGSGLGLGLFVARTLAEQLGGDLTLTRVETGGTRATLSLPESEFERQ